jgi:MFS family permease
MLGFDFSPDVRRVLRVEVPAMLMVTAFTGLTSPFHGLILRRELGATPFQLSVLAAGNAACLLLSLVLVRLVDTRRPLPWVVWPGFAARALFLLVPWVTTPWPFVGILVTGTLLGAVAGPAQAALIQRLYPASQRGRALGAVRVSGALAAIALAVGAGLVIGRLGYRLVFCAAALFGMAASLRQLRLPVPPAPVEARDERGGLGEAWRVLREDAAYRRLLVASFVFGAGIWLQMPATPLLLVDVFKITTAQAGLLSAAAAAAALVGNVLWGRLADRTSSLLALRAVYLVGALAPLAYCVAGNPWVLATASIAESLMATGLDLVWILAVIDHAGPRRTAQYAAIAATLAGVRGVIGPLLGAVIIHTLGLQAVYLAAAGFMALGAFLVSRQTGLAQNTPRYIEQPRHTSGGLSPSSAALNAT